MSCPHRKVRVRAEGGQFFAVCQTCAVKGNGYAEIGQAFLRFREDLVDAAALRAAEAAKALASREAANI
jgi:hypothetical protein